MVSGSKKKSRKKFLTFLLFLDELLLGKRENYILPFSSSSFLLSLLLHLGYTLKVYDNCTSEILLGSTRPTLPPTPTNLNTFSMTSPTPQSHETTQAQVQTTTFGRIGTGTSHTSWKKRSVNACVRMSSTTKRAIWHHQKTVVLQQQKPNIQIQLKHN